jgi:fumarylacetoacetate (FAA) hydrolase
MGNWWWCRDDLTTAHYAERHRCRITASAGRLEFYFSPQLEDLSQTLNQGKARHAFPFDSKLCMAPLPRAYQWADGFAYMNHVELVRASRNSEVPAQFLRRPLDVPRWQR